MRGNRRLIAGDERGLCRCRGLENRVIDMRVF